MAKMFYTMDEAKVALGRTEDEIKTLAREGKLREFRDGPRLMFKADQVDALKGSLPSKDGAIDIADSGAPISLMDSRAGTKAGSSAGSLAGSASGVMSIKDDTSMGGSSLGGSRAGGSRSGSASGVNIFATDEDNVDPSAATAITPASEAANMEAVGSGSGLLDLTRESDDTSLGAVLDEISPGKRESAASRTGSAVAVPAASAGPVRVAAVPVVRPDASAPFFGGLAFGGVLVALVALFVLAAGVNGASVKFVDDLAAMKFPIIAAILAGVALLCGAIGFGVGKVLK